MASSVDLPRYLDAGFAVTTNDLIRFVTSARHPPYGHRSGLFVTAYKLRRINSLSEADNQELCDLLTWFETNLKVPTRLTNSKYPRAKETAISWVRVTANEHMSRLRRLAALVSASGALVDELRTKRPGYIVYEDSHQVVALPFADTPH
jgi:hypothetical protein